MPHCIMGMLLTGPVDITISACELKSCIPFNVIMIMVYFDCIAMMKLYTKMHALEFTCTLVKELHMQQNTNIEKQTVHTNNS